MLAHAGDNFLGGKDIDNAIIQKLILPSLATHGLAIDPTTHFQLFSYLKELAETAKIELTVSEKTTIDVDVQIDQSRIQNSIEISRTDLLECCRHLLEKTVVLCNKTISEAKVDPATIKKIVLVGGPTQMPILQDFLKESLHINVDGSLDPLTVVAKGAALFGNQTPIVAAEKQEAKSITCQLEVNYSPVTSDDEQMITGKIVCPSETIQPRTIQFASSDNSFISEELVIKNGKFILTLPTGEKGNRYWIYVKDIAGQLITTTLDSIQINRGVSIMGAPLPFSLGVSVISHSSTKGYTDPAETMEFFFSKNSILPLKGKKRFHTLSDLKAGSSENALPICIYEGESHIANRNTLVCHLAITGKSISKDLRRGAPVDITIEINESRELSVIAYLPHSDITLNARETLYFDATKIDNVKKDFKEQITRSDSILESSEPTSEIKTIKNTIKDIQNTIENSASDPDQQRKAEKQVKDLMTSLDQIEAKNGYNMNVAAFWQKCKVFTDYLVSCHPPEKRPEYKTSYNALHKEGLSAIAKEDAALLAHINQKMDQLLFSCQFSDIWALSHWLRELIKQVKEKSHPNPSVPGLITNAQDALTKLDIKLMQNAFEALYPFTQENEKTEARSMRSGITL